MTFTTQQHDVDPITVEVIRNYVQSTAVQMRNVLIRASFNPVVYEMIDFSLGVYDRNGELIAEGPGMPFFMGTLTFTIQKVMEYIGRDNVREGDIFLSTYPYWSGSHPQDAVTICPIFVDGKIFGFTAAKVHWMDIGGKDIYGIDTTDIWQEGLQLFAVRICKAGRIDPELVEIVKANTRLPEGVIGDMNGQISACQLGARKVGALVAKYGAEVVETSIKAILAHGERITRQAISAMPDGEWSAEGAMDSNGIEDHPVPVKVTVRIAGDNITIDTTGSASQQIGPVNCPIIGAISAFRLALKMLTTPRYRANGGCFRPMTVIAPEGSVLNPRPPAPVYLYGWVAQMAGELLFEALSQAVPERSVARSGGDLGGILFSGYHSDDGSYYAGGADECCGQGASQGSDGENALIYYSLGESRNVPAEILEERYPLRVNRYTLRRDSGGPGKFRGGLGVEKVWTALADMKMISTIEQTQYPAKGLFGGRYALPNAIVFSPGKPYESSKGKISNYLLPEGEQMELRMGGGGGWGDPLERDPNAVLQDVIGDYISLEAAEKEYGVVLVTDGDHLTIDTGKTEKLRTDRKASDRSCEYV